MDSSLHETTSSEQPTIAWTSTTRFGDSGYYRALTHYTPLQFAYAADAQCPAERSSDQAKGAGLSGLELFSFYENLDAVPSNQARTEEAAISTIDSTVAW